MSVPTKTEFVDKRVIEALLRQPQIDTDDKLKLSKIYKRIHNNKYTVKYKYSKLANHYGRIYADVGFQGLSKRIRHTLARDNYYDVDMVNAHPTILKQLLFKYVPETEFPLLNNYVEDRQSVIQLLGADPSVSKTNILAIINGQHIDTTKSQHDWSDKALEWLTGFHNSCDTIRKLIHDWDLPIVNDIKKARGNNKAKLLKTLIANVLGNQEDELIRCIERNLLRAGYAVDTYVFDGVMVRKNDRRPLTQEVLETVRNNVRRETGFDMPLAIKPMDCHYEVELKDKGFTYQPDDDDWEVPEYAQDRFDKAFAYQIPHENPRQLYFRLKKYIELYFAQVRSPACYLLQSFEAKTHQFIKKGELIELMASLPKCSLTPVLSDKMPEFITLWVKDPYMRSYDRVDYIPYNADNSDCPLNVFNLFTGFSDHIHAPYELHDTDALLEPFYKLLSTVSEHNNDIIDYIERWIARIIQKPAEKVPVALVLTGPQGTGKNVFVNMIRELIGDKNFYTTADLKTLFGNHASGMYQKLLVNPDEVNLANSAQYTERMKQAITQDDLNVNLKNIQEFSVKSPCSFAFTSNYSNPIRIDVNSKDRRFVVVRTDDDLQRTFTAQDWTNMVQHFKTPEFISCLYDRLMSIDIDGFQWINARPMTEARNLLYESSVPAHVHYLCETINEKCADPTNELYQGNLTDKIDISRKTLYLGFKSWADINGFDEGKLPTNMVFTTRVKGLQLPLEHKIIKGNHYYRFNPFVVRDCLKSKYPFMY